eukprot:g1745.t1
MATKEDATSSTIWICGVCAQKNSAERQRCETCGRPKSFRPGVDTFDPSRRVPRLSDVLSVDRKPELKRKKSLGEIESAGPEAGSLKWEGDADRDDYPKWLLTADQGVIEKGRKWEGNRRGILKKRGRGIFHKKKKRYFTFRNQYMIVFKNEPSNSNALPHAAYDVEQLEGEAVHGNQITLSFPGGTEHVLVGHDKDDVEAWRRAIDARRKWLFERRKKRRERFEKQKKNLKAMTGLSKGFGHAAATLKNRLHDFRKKKIETAKTEARRQEEIKRRAAEKLAKLEEERRLESQRRLREARNRSLALAKEKLDQLTEEEEAKRRAEALAEEERMLVELERKRLAKRTAHRNVMKFRAAGKLAATKPWMASLTRARDRLKAKREAANRSKSDVERSIDDLALKRITKIREIRRAEREWSEIIDDDIDAADDIESEILTLKRELKGIEIAIRHYKARQK